MLTRVDTHLWIQYCTGGWPAIFYLQYLQTRLQTRQGQLILVIVMLTRVDTHLWYSIALEVGLPSVIYNIYIVGDVHPPTSRGKLRLSPGYTCHLYPVSHRSCGCHICCVTRPGRGGIFHP